MPPKARPDLKIKVPIKPKKTKGSFDWSAKTEREILDLADRHLKKKDPDDS